MTTTAATQAVTFPFKFQIPVPEGMSNQLGFPELPATARLFINLAGEFTHEQALAVANGIQRLKVNPERAIRHCLDSDSVDMDYVISETMPAMAKNMSTESGQPFRSKEVEQISLEHMNALKEAVEARHWESFGKSVTLSPQQMQEMGIDPLVYIETTVDDFNPDNADFSDTSVS